MRNPSSSSSSTAAPRTTKTNTTTPCCTKIGLKKGPWTPEEDEKLGRFIKKEGEGSWRTLPKRAGLLRCGKSCRLRWVNYLRPNVKRGRIAPDEEDLILRLHRLLGNRWSMIAGRIPGRTDNEIKNYWNTHLSKKLISQGIDPRTHKPLQSFDPKINNNDDPQPSSSKPDNIHTIQNPNPNPNPSPNYGLDETIIYQNNGNHGLIENTDGIDLDSHGQTIGVMTDNGDENNMNYCTNDDMFTSFLNAFINEDAFFSQQQPLQQVNHQSHNGDIEPLFGTSDALISYAQAFRMNTSILDTTMMSAGFNLGSDPRRFDEDHVE